MCDSDDSQAGPSQTLRERYRDWLPGALAVFGLLGIAKLGQLADRHAWWFHGQYELLSLIVFASMMAALCVGLLTILRIMTILRIIQPSPSGSFWPRILSTAFFAIIGFKVGGRYIHLCMAGSRLIEGLAMLGTPVLVGAVVFVCKGRVLGYVIATCVLTIIWLLARPYLDWAHGN